VETFESMRDALEPGGVAGVWFQGYLMSEEDFQTALRTFQTVFDEAHLWNAGLFDFLVTGHMSPLVVDTTVVGRRLEGVSAGQARDWAGLREPIDLQRHYLMGPQSLRAYVGPGPVQRDRDPFLEFTAPHALYDETHRLDLLSLLARRELLPFDPQGEGVPTVEAFEARRQTSTAIERAILTGTFEDLLDTMHADVGHPAGRQRLAHLMHARALEMFQQGRPEEAREVAESVITLEPSAYPAWLLSARIAAAQSEPDRALEILRDGRDLQPWNVYAHLELGRYAIAVGRTHEGWKAIEEARRLDSELPELVDYLATVTDR